MSCLISGRDLGQYASVDKHISVSDFKVILVSYQHGLGCFGTNELI